MYLFLNIQVECRAKQNRSARQTNETYYQWGESVPAGVRQESAPPAEGAAGGARGGGVVAQGGAALCAPAAEDALALELLMMVDSKDIMSADTLVRADHRSTLRNSVFLLHLIHIKNKAPFDVTDYFILIHIFFNTV